MRELIIARENHLSIDLDIKIPKGSKTIMMANHHNQSECSVYIEKEISAVS